MDGVRPQRGTRSAQPTHHPGRTADANHRVLAETFGSVWLASRGGTLRIDPVTLDVSAQIGARRIAIAVGSGSLWVLDTGRRPPTTIRKIDPATNRVVDAATVSVQG